MKFLSLIVLASAASASYLDAVNVRRSPDAVEARQPHGPTKSNAPLAARHGPEEDDHPTRTRVVARKAHGPDGDDDHEGGKKGGKRRRRQAPQTSAPPGGSMPGMGHSRRQAAPPKPSSPSMPGMPMDMGHA
ncbi:hypothetical protein E2P81_ATG08182 [Venturia nashicola]|uniref:Uncharacterized protein n=1 Tax=Venturia nashicola TaxID=86259 RepID=A0A4Z1NVM8_9PEZI|nr:hypothetical protein E6O75_ATG08360 [Venturia nashicola]TLD21594.1 hypothetical protein E2P81_ATG08182 [Venturia nashicola]